MLKKIIHFFKYNNAAVFIVLAVFLLTGGVFAQTETGQDVIGQKETKVTGEDNAVLLQTDLEKFDMDFKIGKIDKDDKYFYVNYTFLDIVKENGVWQYQMREKQRRVPVNIEKDLGAYLVEELSEHYKSRVDELKTQKEKETGEGKKARQEITEYDGLIGQTLKLTERVFPGYEAVKKNELPSPSFESLAIMAEGSSWEGRPDNLTEIYEEYVSKIDEDNDDVLGNSDNCPFDHNPEQSDADADGMGDVCDMDDNSNQASTPASPTTDVNEADQTTEDEPLIDDQTLENNTDTEAPTESGSDLEPDVEIIELNQ